MLDPTTDDPLVRTCIADIHTTLRSPESDVTSRGLLEALQRFRRAASAELLQRITQLDQTVTQQTHMIEQLHQLIDTVIVQRQTPREPG